MILTSVLKKALNVVTEMAVRDKLTLDHLIKLRLKIEETFVNVNKLFRDCSFSNNWTKQ